MVESTRVYFIQGTIITRNETDSLIKEENTNAHSAPITALNFHPIHQSKSFDFSKLLLTASMDWSMKLWNSKDLKAPLLTFDTSSDYVLDLHWNPMLPYVFASTDADGYLDIWDLLKDREMPKVHYSVEGKRGICKMRWSPDARKIALGMTNGALSILQTDKELYQMNPSGDDCSNFDKMLQGLQGITTI